MSIRCSGLREPELHHRQQAVSAGDDARVRSRAAASDAIAPSTLVARSYSNGAGVCIRLAPFASAPPGRHRRLARERGMRGGAEVGVAARTGPARRCRSPASAAASPGASGGAPGTARASRPRCRIDVAQHRALRARGGDRRLAAEPRERQRAARVDLGDPRRRDPLALREVAKPGGGGARIEPVDRPTASVSPAFLTSRPSSASTPASRLRVDRRRRPR